MAKARLNYCVNWQIKWDFKQAMAVGDGANDLPMLSIAGLGVLPPKLRQCNKRFQE
jgi:phosphoserine phosphatase